MENIDDMYIDHCIRYIIGNEYYRNTGNKYGEHFMNYITTGYNKFNRNKMTIYMSDKYHVMRYYNKIVIHCILDKQVIYYTRLDKKPEILLFRYPIFDYFNEIIMEKFILNNRSYDSSAGEFSDADCYELLNSGLSLFDNIEENYNLLDDRDIVLTWCGGNSKIVVYVDYVLFINCAGNKLYIRDKKNALIEYIVFYAEGRVVNEEICKYKLDKQAKCNHLHNVRKRYILRTNRIKKMIRGISITLVPTLESQFYIM